MRTQQPRPLPDRRELCLAGLGIVLSAGPAVLWPRLLWAQAPEQSDSAVRVGDHWTYATKDEITGLASETYTHTVTEIGANRIVIGASSPGRSGSRPIIFDGNWNRLEGRGIRFSPHNGLGFPVPLPVGKEWQTGCEARSNAGAAWKDSVTSKCVAQEAITTPAGTFDAFRVETHRHETSTTNPAKYWDDELVRWYAPEINRWIRWNSTGKERGHLLTKRSEELIEFGRGAG